MRKSLSLVMALACMLSLFGCSKERGEGPSNGQAYFNAIVLKLNDGSVDVECIKELNSGIPAGEKISVPTDVVAASGAPEMAVDKSIRVVFNGDVMESDPLQIGTVFAIYLLDENGEAIPND